MSSTPRQPPATLALDRRGTSKDAGPVEAVEHPGSGEFRQRRAEGFVQPEHLGVDQLQRGHGQDRSQQRGDLEEGVRGHPAGVDRRACPESAYVGRTTACCRHSDGLGDLTGAHRSPGQFIDSRHVSRYPSDRQSRCRQPMDRAFMFPPRAASPWLGRLGRAMVRFTAEGARRTRSGRHIRDQRAVGPPVVGEHPERAAVDQRRGRDADLALLPDPGSRSSPRTGGAILADITSGSPAPPAAPGTWPTHGVSSG
jgi:hypothetical protein